MAASRCSPSAENHRLLYVGDQAWGLRVDKNIAHDRNVGARLSGVLVAIV
jgi:hypothetical protein